MQSKSKMLIAALALAVSAAAYAEDGEKKPQVLRASFLPEATQKYISSIGLTDIQILNEFRHVESAPFLGKGSLDYSKPFGVIGFVIAPDAGERFSERNLEENGALILPVNKDFATIDSITAAIKDRNAEPVVEGSAVTSKRGNFKRTDNTLIYSRGLAYTQIGDNPFAADYKPGTLASASLDFAAARKAAPKMYEAFWNQIAREFYPGQTEASIHEAFVKFARAKIDSVDTLNFVIAGDDKGLRASAVLAPMNVKPTLAAFPRPTFPTPPAVEFHIAYPDSKSAAWLADTISSIDFSSFVRLDVKDGADEKQMERIKQNIVRGAKILSTAEATSLGITIDGDDMMFLLVNQYARDVDIARELSEIADAANALAKEFKMTKFMEVSTTGDAVKKQLGGIMGDASAPGSKFTRVLFLDNEKPVCYLDVAQSGRTAAITFTQHAQDGLAARLLASPTKGKLDAFMTLSLNLKPLVELGLATHSVPRRDGEALKEAVGDIVLTAAAKSDAAGKSMTIETNIPAATAKELGGVLNRLFAKRESATESTPAPDVPAEINEGRIRK